LTDFVDLRSAIRARAHRRGLPILHRDRLGVHHFDLALVLQTVAFQLSPSSVEIRCLGQAFAHSRVGSYPSSTPIQTEFSQTGAQSATTGPKSNDFSPLGRPFQTNLRKPFSRRRRTKRNGPPPSTRPTRQHAAGMRP